MMIFKKAGLLVIAVLTAAVAMAQDVDTALFAPSVRWERQNDREALLTVTFRVADNSYVYENQLRIDAPPGVTVVPAGGDEPVAKEGEESRVFLDDFTRHYRLQGALALPMTVAVSFQGCSDGICMLPETVRFTLGEAAEGQVAAASNGQEAAPALAEEEAGSWLALATRFQERGRATGYMDQDAFLAWAAQAEEGALVEDDVLRRVFTRYGLLLAALLVIPLGLLLNLTPCVLPMIPINLTIIGAGAKAGGKGRGFRQGGVYGLGMALTYGALGLLAVLTGGRFGALNASPWFNLAVAVIFVILALAMFDVLVIDLSRWRRGGGSDGGAMGLTGIFVLGAVAAVLGGACVAPVLIWVLLLATDLWSRGNAVGLALPFLLGIGMALPWPVLGAGMARMPRPGAWMEHVKRVIGVLILLAAAYYVWLAFSLFRPPASGAAQAPDGWQTDLVAAMRTAEQTGQPLFLDFWGVTCKSCTAMKATTFKEPAVIQRMQPWLKVAVQADAAHDEFAAAVLRHYEVVGLPTYLLLQVTPKQP